MWYCAANAINMQHEPSNITEPFVIEFDTKGVSVQGYLSIADALTLPFAVRRLFWTYFTPQNIVRGRHAHHRTAMILIAVHGRIRLETENRAGLQHTFLLEEPSRGVYLPPYTWHTMAYSHDAVQLVLANTDYDAADYIRDYDDFVRLREGFLD
jgi:WxcM-like, C-terminal